MDKIKESFDSLPVAVCFFDANGVVRLINHRMLAVANALRKNGVQTLAEMESALRSPPADICCIDPQLLIYRFADGSVMRFSRESITTKAGMRYTQVTAADVTELMGRQAELREENEKLAQANDRMRRLFEQMPEIIREEETLRMKLNVHDDIGHSILAARRALLRQGGLDDLKASAALWEQAITILYRSNYMHTQPQSPEDAADEAAEMGVRVLTEGGIPDTRKNRAVFALAIRECAANCVRHADGTELYVCFIGSSERDTLTVTNNGTPPQENIREGGGLSMLRRRVEEAGGSMEIKSIPRFELIINLPREEATAHESDDC